MLSGTRRPGAGHAVAVSKDELFTPAETTAGGAGRAGPRCGHPWSWSAGAAAADICRRWERRAKSTLSATIPIVNHQL